MKIMPDDWNRIVVLNSPRTKNLEIRYNPFDYIGFGAAGISLIFSVISF